MNEVIIFINGKIQTICFEKETDSVKDILQFQFPSVKITSCKFSEEEYKRLME